jgi:NTE family protein
MDALVLGGGNIKGAYQAGIIAGLLEAGYEPEIVTGISVGALNAAYLAGLTPRGSSPMWPDVGRAVESFWRTRVRSPRDFVRRRGLPGVVLSLIRRRWNGLVDTDGLAAVVRDELGRHPPSRTGLVARVGAVNLLSGKLEYRAPDDPAFVDHVLASTAEPVAMPLRFVYGQPYYDGGLRDVTPLKQALELGATRIVCAVCQPEALGPAASDFDRGDAFALVGRVSGIVVNEIVRNDVEYFLEIDAFLALLEGQPRTPEVEAIASHPFIADKRRVPILVVRPKEEIRLDLEHFTPDDIERLIEQGRCDALRELRAARAKPSHPGYPIARCLRVPPPSGRCAEVGMAVGGGK